MPKRTTLSCAIQFLLGSLQIKATKGTCGGQVCLAAWWGLASWETKCKCSIKTVPVRLKWSRKTHTEWGHHVYDWCPKLYTNKRISWTGANFCHGRQLINSWILEGSFGFWTIRGSEKALPKILASQMSYTQWSTVELLRSPGVDQFTGMAG